MKESSPWYDVFYQVNGDLHVITLRDSLKKIITDHFSGERVNVSVKADQVTYTIENLDELSNFSGKEDLIEMINCNVSKTGLSFHFIIQWNNPISGKNGNFRVMLGTKELNKATEEYLFKTLNLKTFDLNAKLLAEEEMKINPIFKGRNFTIKKGIVFVLMPFTLPWSERLWKHLTEICKKNNLTSLRANNLYGHDVLEDIWESINSAEYIIADMSSKNPNVMYEIGIAHTLGKKTILLSQDQEDIPFDFRRYRILLYEDNVDGFQKLANELPSYLI